jgi:hypothetical protein
MTQVGLYIIILLIINLFMQCKDFHLFHLSHVLLKNPNVITDNR